MSSVLTSAFFFVVALGILIAVHEYGHYWMARKMGVKVLRFSIGFGKALWTRRAGPDDTEYTVAAIPLGGYVKMLDEREGDVAEHELHRAFNRKPVGARFAIVAAGPLANFLLAIVAYWMIFMLGVTGVKPVVGMVAPGSIAEQSGMQRGDLILAVGGEQTATWNAAVMALLNKAINHERVDVLVEDGEKRQRVRILNTSKVPEELNQGNFLTLLGLEPFRPAIPPVIGELELGGPAERAGMRPGDRIVAVDGAAAEDWDMFVTYVRERPDKEISIKVDRSGESLTLAVRPARVKSGGGDVGRIGAGVFLPETAGAEVTVVQRYGVAESLRTAVVKTWEMSVFTLRMLGEMIVGDVSVANISGPLSIAKYAGYSASAGLVTFLTFMAAVSISLGVLNLLPIPILDGGHLFYYCIEMLKGSPLSDAVQAVGQRIGIAMLVLIMVVAFYNDIVHLFG